MTQNDRHGKGTIPAYKWLKRGAVDPDRGFVWRGRAQEEHASQPESLTGVHAYLLDGLAYAIEDELWEVELREVAPRAPVTSLNTSDEPRRQHRNEVTLFARTGSRVRQIVAWSPNVAEEFARECALEARGRALQALSDATKVLSDAQADDAQYRPERSEVSSTFLNSAAELEARGREAVVAGHTATLLNIWCSARAAHGSPAQLASAYAEAAAFSRAAAALTYAAEIDPLGNRGSQTAAEAYADERRRQATWLAKRLGLADRSVVSASDSNHEERRTEHAEVSSL